MKPKTMILMVAAVACGLGASYMTSRYLQAARPEAEAEPTVPVLVAKARIQAWTPIKEPDKFFEVKQYPANVAPRKALSDLNDIKDQRLKLALEEGKPVTQDDLLTKEQMSIAESLKPGQRAVAIKVTPESVVGGFVLPGTRVDVLCTTRGNDPETKVILQNMLVLAVDTQDQRGEGVKTILGQNITLAATPEEAGRLTLGTSIGELRLMLKSQTDTTSVGPVVVRWKDLGNLPGKSSVKEDDKPRVEAPPVAPPLPPVVEEPKEQPRPVVKPRKDHELKIITGATVEKHRFPHKDGDEEDADTPATDGGGSKAPKTEAKKPEPKPAPAPQAKKEAPQPAPQPAGGKLTRKSRMK